MTAYPPESKAMMVSALTGFALIAISLSVLPKFFAADSFAGKQGGMILTVAGAVIAYAASLMFFKKRDESQK